MDALHSASREISDRTSALTVEMRRREEAQAALVVAQRREAFGQLAAGIAHDFNNLLAVILGNNEILENRLADQKARELLSRSTNAAEMGARLTRRLLTFARQQPRAPIPINLNDQILSMVELLRGSLRADIELSTKLAKDVGMTIVDPSEVENAIMNLAINARDAMPNGGKLTFETRSVGVDGAQGLEPGNYVVLSVSDTGQGMAPEIVARAFEPFFTTKGAQGTGLGLATIYGFVKQSGGNVTIQSELGHGTTVALWLPMAKGSAEAVKQDHQAVAPKTAKGAERLVVLAVDDNAIVLLGTTAMLEGLGHRALKATSGKEALDILRREELVDLVITDQAMPGMTGVQLANVIKVEWPAMPILLVTGYAELPPGPEPGLPKLAKPFGQQDLARAIGKVMKPDQASGRVVKFRAR